MNTVANAIRTLNFSAFLCYDKEGVTGTILRQHVAGKANFLFARTELGYKLTVNDVGIEFHDDFEFDGTIRFDLDIRGEEVIVKWDIKNSDMFIELFDEETLEYTDRRINL